MPTHEESPDVNLDVLIAVSSPLRKALLHGDLDVVAGPIQATDEAEFECQDLRA